MQQSDGNVLVVPETVHFHETVDIAVVGYGYAGGVAAIEAHDVGARVVVFEKMPNAGGISICSGGGAREARNAALAFKYLRATNDGRTPDEVIAVLAEGMVTIGDYLHKLGALCKARITSTESRPVEWDTHKKGGNYPLPGWETFFHLNCEEIPGFDHTIAYPHVKGSGGGGGARFFRIVEANVEARKIDVRLATPVLGLLVDADRTTLGVRIQTADGERWVKARKAVILACGGFEANEAMKKQYWQMSPVLPVMARSNTGDGIRMAQQLGADLWHMWHYHGSYGFKHPNPDYPYAIRVKRLPDWFPSEDVRARVPMAWILVDQKGRRFMNENAPYTQDTNHRPMELFDPVSQTFPRIPAHLICDENGRKMYRLGMVTYNELGESFQWSEDNLQEVQMGILRKADSIAELAGLLSVEAGVLEHTIDRWNAICERDRDEDFDRPAGSMVPIRTPPFYTGEVWPVVSNTQGGPVHNAHQQVVDVTGRPLPRLYAAGELGSSFGFLYISGGNLTECFVTGRVAARHAVQLPAWDA